MNLGTSIKIVSLNIERSKHLDLVVPFLGGQKPDVVCVQELYERDISTIAYVVGPCIAFAPSGRHPADPPEQGSQMIGVGIFTQLPVARKEVSYYMGGEEQARTDESRTTTRNLGFIVCDVEKGGNIFRIGTLHFMWTPDGKPNDEQRQCLTALSPVLGSYGEMVFVGDMNAPRGGEIFSALAEKYKDNIPAHYTTSIDKDIHRAGPLPYMVDGLFSTLDYVVSDVELCSGVSDHMAIVATIRKSTA